MEAAKACYHEEKILGSDDKDVISSEVFKVCGVEIDSREGDGWQHPPSMATFEESARKTKGPGVGVYPLSEREERLFTNRSNRPWRRI